MRSVYSFWGRNAAALGEGSTRVFLAVLLGVSVGARLTLAVPLTVLLGSPSASQSSHSAGPRRGSRSHSHPWSMCPRMRSTLNWWVLMGDSADHD